MIASVVHLDAFLILGEARGELKKRLDRHKLIARVAGIETADKMTEPQLAAKVREHFNGTAGLPRSPGPGGSP